jgi:hypothetical protein
MCKQSLAAPEELANQLIDCPTCAQTIEVPLHSRQPQTDKVPPPIPLQPPPKLPPVQSYPPQPSRRHGIFYYVFWGTISLFATFAILFVGFIFLTGFLSALNESTPQTIAPASGNASAPVVHLRVGKWSWHKSSSSHVTAEGEITNISGESLKNVEAVVTFRTRSGDFITSDSAIIDYNPILPNQTSPWKVIATWNPEMETASVQFKTLWGRTLNAEKEK